jgi:hypothetical protein
MKANRSGGSAPVPSQIPPVLTVWLSIFRPCFTAPVWNHVVVLVTGAVLAPGKRTVTQALRVMGLGDEPGFGRYHEVLNRARWDTRALARRLLLHVLDRLLPAGPVVIGIDDTIERRWGARIKARGIYRDPVRSSKGHFVKACPCEGGGQWPALAVFDGHRTHPLGRAAMGAAVSDHSRALRAMERSERQTAQDTHRLGAAGDPANQTLAAGPRPDLRRRQRLRRS